MSKTNFQLIKIETPMKKIILLPIFLLYIAILSVNAQTIIQGVIKDVTTNEPLIGSFITIKGTKLGDTARYIISFECKKCHCRNTKTCTKRAYEKGLVVIKCDGCSVMHLIADNIGWFDKDKKVNFEQLMQEQGESVTKISYQNINNNNNTSLKENKEIKESNIVELHNDYTNIKDKNKNTNKYTF